MPRYQHGDNPQTQCEEKAKPFTIEKEHEEETRFSENSKTVEMKQSKNPFLCNQCEYSFKLENNLENHMEYMHKE